MCVRNNKSATKESILRERIDDLDTWPFKVYGVLIERFKKEVPEPTLEPSYQSWVKDQDHMIDEYVKRFQDNRRLALSWLFAAVLAVSGNLAINSLFGTVNLFALSSNISLFLFSILIFIVFLLGFLIYVPIDPGFRFPFWTEKALCFPSVPSLENDDELLIPPILRRAGKIDSYAMVIAFAIVRDWLSWLGKPKALVIKEAKETQFQHVPYISFNLGLKSKILVFEPAVPEKILYDLTQFVQQLRNARISIEVMDFEISERVWKERGKEFRDRVMDMNFDSLRAELLDQMKRGWASQKLV